MFLIICTYARIELEIILYCNIYLANKQNVIKVRLPAKSNTGIPANVDLTIII